MRPQQALHNVTRHLRRNTEVIAAFSVGSLQMEQNDSYSDIDLIVFVKPGRLKGVTEFLKNAYEGGFSNEKQFRAEKLMKLNILTSDWDRLDILLAEPDAKVIVKRPYKKIVGSLGPIADHLNESRFKKTAGEQVLRYGKRDLPFEILYALKMALRGKQAEAIKHLEKIIKSRQKR